MLDYKAIEIFTNEAARCGSKPVVEAVLQYVHDLNIAARCIVTRGISGCYENGEVATRRLKVLSFNLPVQIYIVVPSAETQRIFDGLTGMIRDGIVALQDLNVISRRTQKTFFRRHLKVRDVMTHEPKYVKALTPLSDTTRLLLSSIFTGLPVLDDQQRPIGVITQGDLIRNGGLPLRLSLLAESDQHHSEAVFHQLASRHAGEVMTSPVVMTSADRSLTEAVDLMLTKDVKRLPVVDSHGGLIGMLSRLDIFRTVMCEAPDWTAFQAKRIELGTLKRVCDILRRDMHCVLPDTTLEKVIQIIDTNDIQRVAVVDPDGKLLGLISDRDLLRFFKPKQEGIWHLLSKIKYAFLQEDAFRTDFKQCLADTRADTVMTSDLITVHEEMPIEAAIGLMIEKGLKRLPAVDAAGRFQGMISRDSLLRVGFGQPT
jgi:CBS domain-containing protein